MIDPFRFIFRTDASLEIGTGHVMRCLTLADALRSRGIQCHFVCREHPGHLLELINQRGYRVTALPVFNTDQPMVTETSSHARWLGASWQADTEATLRAIGPKPAQWLVVDHYALDTRWEQTLHSACHRLMVIDDLADRPHDCHLLLDQNLGRAEKDYQNLTPAHCVRLIGPTYALLRPEFGALRPYSLARRQTAKFQRLLITMGGVDKNNATGQVLDALRVCALPQGLQITVIMGPYAPWLEQVRKQATQMPCPTQVLVGVTDMAQLMADSDLAIGAAGSTSWERCALGLPTFLIILAKNQQCAAKALSNTGAVEIIELNSKLEDTLSKGFELLKRMPNWLKNRSIQGATISDGKGVMRVLDTLLTEDKK